MANDPNCRRRNSRPPAAQPPRPEPPMRRWPHPVSPEPPPQEDASLRYIRCALSYQNQLLSEIKTLLEEIAQNTAPAQR